MMQALGEAGLHDARLEWLNPAPSSMALGARLLEQILAMKPAVDAIFFCNDDLAQGALLAAARHSIKVPEQIAIAGFNDLPGSDQMIPPLTTIRTPRSEIGEAAAVMLLKLIRGPMLVGFSTASSESVYPKLMEQLEKFGIKNRVTSFVLPLGYSFNLDGSMLYTGFAALFVAQAYGIPMSLGEQITMLLVLMISSKGIAGVPRASLVVVAAVLPMFGLPEAGILLILGIDHFLDMGRTLTNVLGNAIATAVVAKWEGDEEQESCADLAVEPQLMPEPIRVRA